MLKCVFDGKEDTKKCFYAYKNVVTKINTVEKKAEKLVAFLKADAFDCCNEYFTEDNAPTEEAKLFQVVKKAMLENISTKKTEAETIKEAVNLQYAGDDVKEFIVKAEKLYKEFKFSENIKFGMIQEAITFDQALMYFVLL